jgi:hypothetical protein
MCLKLDSCITCRFLLAFQGLRINSLFPEVLRWFVHYGFLLRACRESN